MSTDDQFDAPILVEPHPPTESFLAGAYRRIQLAIAVVTAVLVGPVFYVWGWRVGGGFLLGAGLAYLNFLWLKQSIIALTDSINEHSPPTRSRSVVFKFIFRYAVIGVAAYAIISSSSFSVLALLAGFSLSVVALLFEAVAETVYGLRHGK